MTAKAALGQVGQIVIEVCVNGARYVRFGIVARSALRIGDVEAAIHDEDVAATEQ